MTMSLLTIHDIKPGCLYTVVDAGSRREPGLLLAIVIGADVGAAHKAVTVRVDKPIGRAAWTSVGTTWGPEDAEARFVPLNGPVVLLNPA